MDYKEAYRRLKKKFPDREACGYTLYRNRLFVFPFIPPEGSKDIDGVTYGLSCYSVDRNSGEINNFDYITALNELVNSPGGTFNEKDIL